MGLLTDESVDPNTESCLFDISRWVAERKAKAPLSDEDVEMLKRQIDLAYPEKASSVEGTTANIT